MLDIQLASRWPDVPALGLFVQPEGAGAALTPGQPVDLPDADLQAFLDDCEAEGDAGSLHTLPRPGQTPRAVHLAGLGAAAAQDWRRAGAALVGAARKVPEVAVAVPAEATAEQVRALTEGLALAAYRFDRRSEPEPPPLQRVVLVAADEQRYAGALHAGLVTARTTVLARDLVNTPSGEKSPAWLAEQARQAAEQAGLTVTVREPGQLAAEGFGGILAVGMGSERGPRLIEVSYTPGRATRHVVLVGKGITFDSGGLSLKPVEGMKLMRKDMGGGAAVLGAIVGAAQLGLDLRLTALIPAAENMPSGTAQRPGDVIRHYGGRTTEVLNTDAEGRLVLADALAYAAARLHPDLLIDLATLTGAQSVALGKRTAALFSTDDTLAKELETAAEAAGEQLWRMPLPQDYRTALDSDVADLNNAPGAKVGAGAVTAALFLREFTDDLPWAHLDMSGPAWSDADSAELVKGATGWGVRTLLRLLEDLG